MYKIKRLTIMSRYVFLHTPNPSQEGSREIATANFIIRSSMPQFHQLQ